jgi:hypothetical protein
MLHHLLYIHFSPTGSSVRMYFLQTGNKPGAEKIFFFHTHRKSNLQKQVRMKKPFAKKGL